ncbi:hypothetical protein [Nocardiopsis sp. YSL2]|uniref:hypothetical protein n=1 Tax=Nocardiopsis sp. YSL2 TaxID=2939492 RepID=UPI0026F4603F|nr:hypothetical protein [Nocardiopsis sp. YSL2]
MHPPGPVSYSQEPIPIGVPDDRPPVMPRRLRVLRVFFGLWVGYGVLCLGVLVFAAIGVFLAPPPAGGDPTEGLLPFEHVFLPVTGVVTAVGYAGAAAQLGKGGPVARRWAFGALGVDVVTSLMLAAVIVVTGGLEFAVGAVLGVLLMPGVFLLLLLTRASREWFRASA